MSLSRQALIGRILALLPEADCGGCPAGTCQKCAEAMVDSGNPALCPAIKQKTVDRIAGRMDVESVKIEEKIAFIACDGCAAGKARFVGNCTTCQEAVDAGFVRGECKDGCVGIGSCIECCKFDAMKLEDGKVVIDYEKCTGCGVCAERGVCPQYIITMIPADASNFIPCSSTVEEENNVRKMCNYGCIACGECERVCPQEAVHIVNNHAVIDYDKCVGCDACTIRCKKKIVVDTLHDLTRMKEKVAFVHCGGGKKAGEKFAEMGITSCDDAARIDPRELDLCTTGCVGLGKCQATCRYGAVTLVDGTAWVDQDKCVGCRDCAVACPKGIISIVPYDGMKLVACSAVKDYTEKLDICERACVGCGDCVENCPNGAIYLEDMHAVVDPELCEDCHMCQYVCARNVISEIFVPEYHFKQKAVMKITKGEE